MVQFQIISHVPRERNVNLQLRILATEEIGDTPSPACLEKATPIAEKNKPIINKIYRLESSFFFH